MVTVFRKKLSFGHTLAMVTIRVSAGGCVGGGGGWAMGTATATPPAGIT